MYPEAYTGGSSTGLNPSSDPFIASSEDECSLYSSITPYPFAAGDEFFQDFEFNPPLAPCTTYSICIEVCARDGNDAMKGGGATTWMCMPVKDMLMLLHGVTTILM